MIIAICNQKGGVGKTTLATNLAYQLAHNMSRVLVMDCDPQGNASSTLGCAVEPTALTMNDVLAGMAQGIDPAKLEAAIVESPQWGLDLIPADRLLASREADAAIGRETRLKRFTDHLHHSRYDHIVIDCPPALGVLTTNALTAAQRAVIVTTARETAADGVAEMISTISAVRTYYNPSLTLGGIIINAYRGDRLDTQKWRGQLKEFYGEYLLDTEIPEREYIARAGTAHTPIPLGIDRRTDNTFHELTDRLEQSHIN